MQCHLHGQLKLETQQPDCHGCPDFLGQPIYYRATFRTLTKHIIMYVGYTGVLIFKCPH